MLLHADDLVLMSEAINGLRNMFIKWKEAFDSKDLKVNFGGKQGNGQQLHHKGWHV